MSNTSSIIEDVVSGVLSTTYMLCLLFTFYNLVKSFFPCREAFPSLCSQQRLSESKLCCLCRLCCRERGSAGLNENKYALMETASKQNAERKNFDDGDRAYDGDDTSGTRESIAVKKNKSQRNSLQLLSSPTSFKTPAGDANLDSCDRFPDPTTSGEPMSEFGSNGATVQRDEPSLNTPEKTGANLSEIQISQEMEGLASHYRTFQPEVAIKGSSNFRSPDSNASRSPSPPSPPFFSQYIASQTNSLGTNQERFEGEASNRPSSPPRYHRKITFIRHKRSTRDPFLFTKRLFYCFIMISLLGILCSASFFRSAILGLCNLLILILIFRLFRSRIYHPTGKSLYFVMNFIPIPQATILFVNTILYPLSAVFFYCSFLLFSIYW